MVALTSCAGEDTCDDTLASAKLSAQLLLIVSILLGARDSVANT